MDSTRSREDFLTQCLLDLRCLVLYPYFTILGARYESSTSPDTLGYSNHDRQLKEKLLNHIGTEPKEIDILDWMGRTTMEFIGQGSLGHQFDAFEGRQNEYRDALRCLVLVVNFVKFGSDV